MFKVDNAVIMAAGTSSRFAPLSYEMPKALIPVKGEVLIERQIRQLKEAGVPEIYIVTGYKSEMFAYLEEKLDELVKTNEAVIERRGMGLMQGLVLKQPVGDVIKRAMEQGLIAISASGNVLRLVPPLIIEKKHVDELCEKLKKAL